MSDPVGPCRPHTHRIQDSGSRQSRSVSWLMMAMSFAAGALPGKASVSGSCATRASWTVGTSSGSSASKVLGPVDAGIRWPRRSPAHLGLYLDGLVVQCSGGDGTAPPADRVTQGRLDRPVQQRLCGCVGTGLTAGRVTEHGRARSTRIAPELCARAHIASSSASRLGTDVVEAELGLTRFRSGPPRTVMRRSGREEPSGSPGAGCCGERSGARGSDEPRRFVAHRYLSAAGISGRRR